MAEVLRILKAELEKDVEGRCPCIVRTIEGRNTKGTPDRSGACMSETADKTVRLEQSGAGVQPGPSHGRGVPGHQRLQGGAEPERRIGAAAEYDLLRRPSSARDKGRRRRQSKQPCRPARSAKAWCSTARGKRPRRCAGAPGACCRPARLPCMAQFAAAAAALPCSGRSGPVPPRRSGRTPPPRQPDDVVRVKVEKAAGPKTLGKDRPRCAAQERQEARSPRAPAAAAPPLPAPAPAPTPTAPPAEPEPIRARAEKLTDPRPSAASNCRWSGSASPPSVPVRVMTIVAAASAS